MSKKEILASIRTHLAASAEFDRLHAEHRHGNGDALIEPPGLDLSPQEITDLFRTNLESVAGIFVGVPSIAAAAAAVQEIVDAIGPSNIALSDLPEVLAIADKLVTTAKVLNKASAEELFDCQIGITCAQWAIAETGTLVLESAREYNRLNSLVPERHICIIDAGNIKATMGEVLSVVSQQLSPTVTFITGPSRTSDIELTLAIGVHGPGELYAIVVEKI